MNQRGVVGLELGLFMVLLGAGIFWLHVELMEEGNKKLDKADKDRIRYTGELQWKP